LIQGLENIPNLFDRFYQVDNSATREHQGTGIGLSLTKELVEQHGGKISVESKSNEGSTFIVLLPFEEGDIINGKSLKIKTELSKTVNNHEAMINDSLFLEEKDISLTKTSDIKKSDNDIILVVEDN